MHKYVAAVMIFYLLNFSAVLSADTFSRSIGTLNQDCESEHSLIVVRASDLPSLLGKPTEHITLWRYQNQVLVPIRSQIDRRDSQKRYLLEDTSAATGSQAPPLSANDEIVFRLADAGAQRLSTLPSEQREIRAEIQVTHPRSEQPHWVYAKVSTTEKSAAPVAGLVRYQAETDTVATDLYQVSFNARHPFLIDDFRWRLTGKQDYSPNVLDSMKIQHTGNMFGFIPFKRTGSDYSSELTLVKLGPLRTIRRTENRVHVLWYLKTPKLYIDYVMMPDSLVMDTIIDIPFKMGLFFDQVETLATVDWRKEESLPPLKIHSPGTASELLVTGQMTAEKQNFNTVSDTRFSVRSDLGTASVHLDIPDDFPITPWLYINDDISVSSPPEHHPGQFGNVGYRTTGWENIDTNVHHLKFTACMSSRASSHAR
ncbi:MAG: hypothetical protein U9Q19_04840 [Pseudomonadota bacterium]|nr:hypothetical protein [Pseudomonadota bacterium]